MGGFDKRDGSAWEFPVELERRMRAMTRMCRQLRRLDPGLTPKLPHLRGVKAVLFDVYGTLLISQVGDISVSERVGSGVLPREGLSPLLAWLNERFHVEELVFEQIHSQHGIAHRQGVKYPEVDILDIWRNILLRCLGPSEQDRWPVNTETVALLAMEYELLVNEATLMPDAVETLRALRAAGLALGIVSNAQFYTRYTLEGLAGMPLSELGFAPELCSWSFEQKVGKPNPRIFHPPLLRLREQGVAAEQVLLVGNDLRKDIHVAQSLGMRTALFVGDRRSLRFYSNDPLVSRTRADARVNTLLQLTELV